MESYAKYVEMPRMDTCLLIDEPAVIVLGRTLVEVAAAVGGFIAFAFVGALWTGLAAAVLIGGFVPYVRRRFPRGFLFHLGWSFGVVFREVRMFTARRAVRVYGP